MTKIDKYITLELHLIIKNAFVDQIGANIRIQKLGNFF